MQAILIILNIRCKLVKCYANLFICSVVIQDIWTRAAADCGSGKTDVPASVKMGLEVAESLPARSGEDWLCWRAINRLRSWVGRAKTVMRRWGYLDDAQSVDCDCGEPQTMVHLLSCRLLDEACTADDLATVTERTKACARKWEKIVWRTRQKTNTWSKVVKCNVDLLPSKRALHYTHNLLSAVARGCLPR